MVLFSNSKKGRKIFLFNDMILIARKDKWGVGKHHLIEKSFLKDIRICDILDSPTLFEIEVMPFSELDVSDRFIVDCPEKASWIGA